MVRMIICRHCQHYLPHDAGGYCESCVIRLHLGAKDLMETHEPTKLDTGKLPIDLVPTELIRAAAEALAFGAKKYSAHNWRKGGGLEWSRIYAALQRHLMAFWDREEQDEESGLSHLSHAAACLGFLLAGSPNKDDRPGSVAPKPGPFVTMPPGWKPGNPWDPRIVEPGTFDHGTPWERGEEGENPS